MSAALDPVKMAILESKSEQSLLDKIVDIVYSKKRITAKQVDSAKKQFDDFLQEVKCNKTESANFNKRIMGID